MTYLEVKIQVDASNNNFNGITKKMHIPIEYLRGLPKEVSQRRHAAAKDPAEAPDTRFRYKFGAYLRKQAATPTW